jgi:PPK2 family polyphosphate:nucleotide phosphotransferase
MGVDVKMVTGDALAIARETAKTLGMGTDILDAAGLGDVKREETAATAESIDDADGFAQVFPEHKFHIVDVLQKRGHIVGMTGDGVNDAPALKKADCGIAVSDATDAARAAASIVLTTPGLSVIIDAIKESRRIFQRMNSYAIYRIAETLRVLLFVSAVILIYNFFPVTAIQIVMLALLNDGAILSIAYDKVRYRQQPEAWNMRLVLGIATVLGIVGPIAAFGMFYLGDKVFHLDHAHLQTLMYLTLSVAGHLTIFLARTRGPFWSIRPARVLVGRARHPGTGDPDRRVRGLHDAHRLEVRGLGLGLCAGVVPLTDRIKLVAYRILDPVMPASRQPGSGSVSYQRRRTRSRLPRSKRLPLRARDQERWQRRTGLRRLPPVCVVCPRCDGARMKLERAVIEELMVRPAESAGLASRSTQSTTADWMGATKKKYKKVAEEDLGTFVDELTEAQSLFWANDTHALLIVLQAMDAAGKDGTIRHVMSGVNPQGCKVDAFKQPSSQELGHDFLWRSATVLPERGMIGIFNRSYYEEVLVVRVHPELLGRGKAVAKNGSTEKVWRDRYEDINGFERHLHRSGTRVVKIFLHVSREEQKKRFLERLDQPAKNWKFSANDLTERAYWGEYQSAYEEALTATSTPWAPWFVVPADHKYAARALVGGIVVNAIDALDLEPPELDPQALEALARAKEELLAE